MFRTIRNGLFAGIAAVAMASSAEAVVFDFSFSNVEGPVAGTVEGSLTLPDGDGMFAATSVIVDSAPAALGYTLPFDVLANLTLVVANSFTVAGGSITDAEFAAQDDPFLGSGLSLGFTGFGSVLSIFQTGSVNDGVIDVSNSTLTFSRVAVPVPATAALLVGGLAAVGIARRRKA